MSTNWKTLAVYDTVYPADSVEWCPFEPYLTHFVCGTYLLLDDETPAEKNLIQERVGNIQLFDFKENNLVFVQKIDSDGILDIKWCQKIVNQKILLGCVTAKGDVKVFEFKNGELFVVASKNLRTAEEGDYMVLSLNWSDGETMCVSDNKGNVAVLNLSSGELTIVKKWKAHELEGWTVAFDPYDDNILYSGGDDAKLKIWDIRSDSAEQKALCSRHDTGVTIIQPDTGEENLILVGSFDEVLNFWDTRSLKVPKNSVKCSGGLWRVKRLQNLILTANIYGGFQIIEMSKVPKVVGKYKEHSSLAYGADWCYNVNSNLLIGTCSFYDKKLTVSSFDPIEFNIQ